MPPVLFALGVAGAVGGTGAPLTTPDHGTRKGGVLAVRFVREREDDDAFGRASSVVPAGQQVLAVSAAAHADGKSSTTGDGEGARMRAAAVSEVGPAAGDVRTTGDGKDAGVRAVAVIGALELAGGDGGVAGDDGSSVE